MVSVPKNWATTPVVGSLDTTTEAPVREIALDVAVAAFKISDAVEPATAQVFGPKYEPAIWTEPAPIDSVPENWTLAFELPSFHTRTCASDNWTEPVNERRLMEASSAQWSRSRYAPAT